MRQNGHNYNTYHNDTRHCGPNCDIAWPTHNKMTLNTSVMYCYVEPQFTECHYVKCSWQFLPLQCNLARCYYTLHEDTRHNDMQHNGHNCNTYHNGTRHCGPNCDIAWTTHSKMTLNMSVMYCYVEPQFTQCHYVKCSWQFLPLQCNLARCYYTLHEDTHHNDMQHNGHKCHTYHNDTKH
jgi:hypothetical protein